MKFTPAQARAIVGVSEQTLRYWKRYLIPLKNKRGHGPSYTHGELLALMVINAVVRELTIDIGRLAAQAESLFAICHQTHWLKYRDSVLRIGSADINIHQDGEQLNQFTAGGPCILVALGPIMEQLRLNLVSQDPDAQLELNWPPLGITILKDAAK
ncbi:hypothetical protein DXT88_15445 [Herbaspirillum lusitanum]|uniref:helix-turn-helix domain-containing protein n=1 Tax=Herbaspirillum lusitanum TaxID=213312 RepID=UPI0022380C7D|nr:helix-turn-helix domain-containing protein [Herbaspirillum lusitanum]MCW5299570.1 hypothetical protein [Herbaspirillum lusitanum]